MEKYLLFRLNIRGTIAQHRCNDTCLRRDKTPVFLVNFSSLYRGERSYRAISQWSKRIGPNVSEYGSSTSTIVRWQKRGPRGLEITPLTIQWRGGFYLFRVGMLVPWPPLLNIPLFNPPPLLLLSTTLVAARTTSLDNSLPGWLPTRPVLFNDFLVHWTQ